MIFNFLIFKKRYQFTHSILILAIFSLGFVSYAQSSKTLIGTVTDSLNQPLENANVLAKSLTEKPAIKFAIADNKGRFKIELETGVPYDVSVSYMGYKEQIIKLDGISYPESLNFKLQGTGETLKEVVINYDYKPIVVKKDTLIYDVKAFANGNERKMREVLEKLPGVEVDKNGNVTVQGKRVTQMLVENKSFFGGGSKLAVENIPADALDKIEVIDHFNQVGALKQVSDSDELAMNVKLKEDKKKFVFGDLEAASSVGSKTNYNLLHAGLFYYSPKMNLSFIGDNNNIGKSTLSFEDLMRFQGGVSTFLSNKPTLTNLYDFTNENTDVIENKSQFAAVNYSFQATDKLDISGFGIFSKTFLAAQSTTNNQYLKNDSLTFENLLQKNSTTNTLGLLNAKLDYSPSKKEKWYYNIHADASQNNNQNTLNSQTNLANTNFLTLADADNASVKQFVEWHKNYNDKNTSTVVLNHTYEKTTPQTNWFTNDQFLQGLIPLETDANYHINQIKKQTNNNIDLLFKHYHIFNNFNHLYTIFGNTYTNASFTTAEKQRLTNGTINDFSSANFGNNITYQLNEAKIGLEYKFKIGKLTGRPALFWHHFTLQTEQESGKQQLTKALPQPQLNLTYDFNTAESLSGNYSLRNTFADVTQFADRFVLQNYNAVFKGNALLNNERFHNATVIYTKMSMYRGLFLNAVASFNKKVRTLRNEVQLQGINQFTTPVLNDNPETNYRLSGSISKKIYKFTVKANAAFSWFNYLQELNAIETENQRNNQILGLSIRTSNKKWPVIEVGYSKTFSQFSGITRADFFSDTWNGSFEHTFLKNFIFNFDYEYLQNTNNTGQRNAFELANTSLRYQRKNKAFSYEIKANNLFNIQSKFSYNFSDFMISENEVFVLPRIVMLSISYKL
ncbi:TonB-dependent receptor [Flavobacterium sp.]|uniref:TonB-dependent receptor n=1 Tax=Flavobacterium sp. TaxID=239 RepID=UPI0026159ABD|nr:TonB-dependent receptor [Flavobacterium sp.]